MSSFDLADFVTLCNATLVTDSRRVAKHFRKRHDNVLRDIDQLDCSENFRLLNFEETIETRANPKGGAPISSRAIRMTKNGFMFLVTGYRGKEAGSIKEAYFTAFDQMAEQLQTISMSLWEQRMALERRDATSFAWASFGSRCMLERRRELPHLLNERELLSQRMQPSLFVVQGDAGQEPMEDAA